MSEQKSTQNTEVPIQPTDLKQLEQSSIKVDISKIPSSQEQNETIEKLNHILDGQTSLVESVASLSSQNEAHLSIISEQSSQNHNELKTIASSQSNHQIISQKEQKQIPHHLNESSVQKYQDKKQYSFQKVLSKSQIYSPKQENDVTNLLQKCVIMETSNEQSFDNGMTKEGGSQTPFLAFLKQQQQNIKAKEANQFLQKYNLKILQLKEKLMQYVVQELQPINLDTPESKIQLEAKKTQLADLFARKAEYLKQNQKDQNQEVFGFDAKFKYWIKILNNNKSKKQLLQIISYLTFSGSMIFRLGDTLKAVKYYKTASQIIFTVRNWLTVEYATILVDIGNCYYFKDFYDEALKSYFEALFIIEKMEGEHLFEKGNVFNNIGNAYFCKIQYDNASKYYQKCHEFLNKNPEIYNFQLTGILHNIESLNSCIKSQTDRNLPPKTEQIKSKIVCFDQPSTSESLKTLGKQQNNKGNYLYAFKYYKKALRIIQKFFGTSHYNYLDATKYLESIPVLKKPVGPFAKKKLGA